MNKIKEKKLHGINVTTPYKKAVIPFLDLIVNDAKVTSSVNTIYLNKENKVFVAKRQIRGQSFIKKIKNKDLIDKNFLILGAGGVTPSLIYALNKEKIKKIFISNRTVEKAKNMQKIFPFIKITNGISKLNGCFVVIINATSLGMKNYAEFKYKIKKYKPDILMMQEINNPLETTMLKNFKNNEIKTFNGMEMFLFQGQKAFSLWNNIVPNIDEELKELVMFNLK